jgi:hypothetical protein
MKSLSLFLCIVCLTLGFGPYESALGESSFFQESPAYKTYSNARFKYSISYPADLLIPQGESENGDGQVFREKSSSSVEMRVYGGYNVNNETLRSRYTELTRKWANGVTYKVIRADWFVVSAMVNGKIHYQKTILRGDVFKTFEIEYDAVRGSTYNDVTTRVAKSFRG